MASEQKPAVHGLVDALNARERAFLQAIDRINELVSDGGEDEVYELTRSLREAVELVACLRRLTKDRSPQEIHRAFGAPGDFGYEHPIGAALDVVYRSTWSKQ